MHSETENPSSMATENQSHPKRLNIRKKSGLDPKVLTVIERIRLAVLLVILVGLGIFAWRYHQKNNDVRAIISLLENEDSIKAIDEIRELEKKWGRSGESSFLRGRAYRYLGDVEQSSRALAQSLNEGYDAARLQHEQLLLDVQYLKPDVTEATAREILASYQADMDENGTALIRGLLRINNIFNAHAVISIWNHEEPDSSRLKYLTGLVAERINEFEKAKEMFVASYESNPNYTPVWLELGMAYWRNTEPEKAYEFFDKYYQRNPSDLVAEAGRIESLLAMGKYQEVDQFFASYDKPLDVSGRARIFRAQAYQGLEKYDRVIELLEPVIAVWPRDIAANEMLAVAYQQAGREEDASKSAEKFREGNEQQFDIRRLREEISKDFQNASLHYQLGHLLLHLYSRNEGFDELQIALQLDETIRPVHEDLAYYYSAIGDVSNAEAHKQYLSSEPKQ